MRARQDRTAFTARPRGGALLALAIAGCGGLLGLDEKREGDLDAGGPPTGLEAGEVGEALDGTALDGAALDARGGGGDAAPTSDGGTRGDARADDVDTTDPDSGCSAMGPVPDGAPRTYYGSCVPHLTGADVVCNQYGYTGALGVTQDTIDTQKSLCTGNFKGTWKDGPCDTTGAVFGCEQISNSGFVCESAVLSWYYPPVTLGDEPIDCPPSIGTVVLP